MHSLQKKKKAKGCNPREENTIALDIFCALIKLTVLLNSASLVRNLETSLKASTTISVQGLTKCNKLNSTSISFVILELSLFQCFLSSNGRFERHGDSSDYLKYETQTMRIIKKFINKRQANVSQVSARQVMYPNHKISRNCLSFTPTDSHLTRLMLYSQRQKVV